HLRPHLPATGGLVIHDLGCGTGAMGRWLAPLLPGPQRWVLHDLDADLLEIAAADPPSPAADGAEVTVEAKQSDITRLNPADRGPRSTSGRAPGGSAPCSPTSRRNGSPGGWVLRASGSSSWPPRPTSTDAAAWLRQPPDSSP